MTRDILIYARDYYKQYLTENLYTGDVGYRIVLKCGINVSGATAEVLVKRADGSVISSGGECVKDTAFMLLPYAAMALSGIITIRIRVYQGENVLTLAEVEGTVEEKIEATAAESDDRMPILTRMISEVRQLNDEIKEAEAEREKFFSECLKAGYTWYIDNDAVIGKDGRNIGRLKTLESDKYYGSVVYVISSTATAGESAFDTDEYTIDGSNGHINLRDYIIWLGRWVRFNVYEAKASAHKNSDGKYSPKSGVDGLFSSTDKAYLTDLINVYWEKEKLPIYTTPEPAEGWQTNWLFNDGWYLGGIKKDCGGHPPVINDNHTSWAILVLNGMNTDADNINHNHRLQIAFDVVNSKIYMRRGWMSENSWATSWTEVGEVQDGSITEEKLDTKLREGLYEMKSAMGGLTFSVGENGILTISKED